MPSVSVACIVMALKAMIAMVSIGAAGVAVVAVVGFPNDYSFGITGTPLFSARLYQTPQFTPGFDAGSCHTCLHIRSDNPDIQQLWDNKPSPTLPLKISYAAPYLHSKPTPTPPPTTHEPMTAPASSSISGLRDPLHGASTLAVSSAWFPIVLRYLVSALASRVLSVIIRKIICLVSFTTMLAYLIPRTNSFRTCLQLPQITKQILGKVTAIILVSFQTPEMLPRASLNGTPNLEFSRPRKVHSDNPEECSEQSLVATVDIEPSFGPSIQNAETEFRSHLERVEGNISRQADIVAFFRKTLDSFTRALAAAEATTEGRNTRYMAVIDDQDRLIDELRLLHEYREQAFQENEELVKSLCFYKKGGEIKIPNGYELKPPFDKYSAEYDKFIISPLDGPAALSMKVSILSAPFHRRPVTILDSDPHWQRFLESIAEKGSEQEARLASHGKDLRLCDGKEEEDVEDGCGQGTHDVSQSSDDTYRDKTEVGADVGVIDAEPPNEDLEIAKNNLIWYEWKLECMKRSQGTPKGSDYQQCSDMPPAITAHVPLDTTLARLAQEDEWTMWPKQLVIDNCDSHIHTLRVEIEHKRRNATSEGRPRK